MKNSKQDGPLINVRGGRNNLPIDAFKGLAGSYLTIQQENDNHFSECESALVVEPKMEQNEKFDDVSLAKSLKTIKSKHQIRGPSLRNRIDSNLSVLSLKSRGKQFVNTTVNYNTIKEYDNEPDKKELNENITISQLDNDRFYMFICVLLAFFAIHSTNMNVSTIIPTHIAHKHKSLKEIDVSYIIMQVILFSIILCRAFEIGGFLFSPIAGLILQPVGRKNSVIFGFIILIIAQFGVGLTQFIEDDRNYLLGNFIFRFFEGVGDSWAQTACYSLISLKFPENREKFIGISEAASGIGLMAGPGIAGLLYAFIGYFNTFMVFVILVAVSGIFCLVYIPNSINQSPNKNFQEDQQSQISKKDSSQEASYFKFFWYRRIIFAILTCAYCCIFFQFKSSFFVTVLEFEKHIPNQYNGIIVSYGSFIYLTTTLLTGQIGHLMPKRIFMLLSFVLISIGMFLMGPSALLGFPNYIWIFLIGQGIVEGAQGFLFIPIIPELIESYYETHGIIEGDDPQMDEDIADRASGLYNCFYYIGMIISPVAGSLIYSHYHSFNSTCDVFGIISVCYTMVYLVFNVVPDFRKMWTN